MEDKKIIQTRGIGFSSLLALAFIVLKLCKVIDWSWWWVLFPLWAPIALVIVILVVMLLILILKAAFS